MKCKRCFNFHLINFSGGAVSEAQIYFSSSGKKALCQFCLERHSLIYHAITKLSLRTTNR